MGAAIQGGLVAGLDLGSVLVDITPHMDQMAAEGMRFEHAYVAASSCVPSRNALMTGRHSSPPAC